MTLNTSTLSKDVTVDNNFEDFMMTFNIEVSIIYVIYVMVSASLHNLLSQFDNKVTPTWRCRADNCHI